MTEAVASGKAFQDKGSVILFTSSDYGANEIADGGPGLDTVDYAAAFPLALTELSRARSARRSVSRLASVSAASIGRWASGMRRSRRASR